MTGELVRGTKDIKMLNAKESFIKLFENNIKIQNQKRYEMASISAKYKYIIESLRGIFEFGLVCILIYLINNNNISIAIALFNYKSGIMKFLWKKFQN